MYFEQTLLRQIRNADPEAFQQLYDRYAPQVYYFSSGFLKSAEATEELVQNVFITVWEKRSTLDERVSLTGYLFSLTCNLLLGTFREKHGQRQPREILQGLTTRSESPIDEEVLYQKLEKLYQQAVDQLPPRCREVYLLSHNGGLSTAQIAQQIRMSDKVVNERMNQALGLLSQFFHQHTY